MWSALIIFVVSTILQIALAPKPQKPTAASLTDFSVPTADPTRSIPVLFGKKTITGANVVGYGDLSNTSIRRGGFFSSTTVGYRYYMYLHFVLGYGPLNAITNITIGALQAWAGNITANGSGEIQQSNLFGGDTGEGGVSGVFDIAFGAPTQAASAFLAAKLGKPVPAYRGVTSLIWKTGDQAGPAGAYGAPTVIKSGMLGTTPYLKPWAITAWRTTAGWDSDNPWYPEKATIGDHRMNPAHILYELFTDPRFGEGQPRAIMDDTRMRAVADALFAENFGLNLLWNDSSTIQDMAQTIIEHIGGLVVFDRSTNKRYVKLIRGDYDPTTLDVFDETSIASMDSFQRKAWGETVNTLTLSYTDATTDQPTSLTIQDLANIQIQGCKVTQTINYVGICDFALAKTVAARELTARAIPVASCTFKINRKFWAYQKADVFKLNWAQEGVAGVVFRVVSINRGTLSSGMMTVTAIEDVYALTGLQYSDVTPINAAPPRIAPSAPPAQGQPVVISSSQTAPPVSPADGDTYIVPAGATDIWIGHDGESATWDAATGTYLFAPVADGTQIYDQSAGGYKTVVGGVVGDVPRNIRADEVSYDDSASMIGTPIATVQQAIELLKTYVDAHAGGGGGGGGGAGGGIINVDVHPKNPTLRDDEFEAGVLSPQWAWLNQGAATADFFAGSVILIGDPSGGNNINAIVESIDAAQVSAGAWIYTARIAANVSGNLNFIGMLLREAATDKVAGLGVYDLSGTPDVIVAIGSIAAGFTAISSSQGANTLMTIDAGHISDFTYYQIELAGGMLIFRISLTGQKDTYNDLYSVAVGTDFTTAPDQIGLFCRAANVTVGGHLICDWFRDYTAGYEPAAGISGGVFGEFVPPQSSGWTLDFFTDTNLTSDFDSEGALEFVWPLAGTNGGAYRRAIGNVDFDVKMFLTIDGTQGYIGLFVRDSSTGNILTFGSPGTAIYPAYALELTSSAGAPAVPAFYSSTPWGPVNYAGNWVHPEMTWLRLRRVGNVYDYFTSMNGKTWTPVHTGLASSYVATMDQIGLMPFGGTTGQESRARVLSFELDV